MRSDGVSPRVGGTARLVCLNSFGILDTDISTSCAIIRLHFSIFSKKFHHMMMISEDEDELDKNTLGKKVI